MQSNTLQKIGSYLTQNSILDSSKVEKFIELLSIYEKGNYIYPEYFMNNSSLTEEECYKSFSHMVFLGILEIVYKVYCPECHHVKNKFLESLNEVEDYLYCESCNSSMNNKDNPYKYLIIAYRVVIDE